MRNRADKKLQSFGGGGGIIKKGPQPSEGLDKDLNQTIPLDTVYNIYVATTSVLTVNSSTNCSLQQEFFT